MRYTPLHLLVRTQTTADLLGNPVEKIIASEVVYAAHASGESMVPVQQDGREVTKTVPMIWTNAPADLLDSAAGVRLDCRDFHILEVQPNLRGGWSLVQLERWKL